MKELPLNIGQSGRMIGILTTPEAASTGRPTVLLLNAGLVHHVGPNRLNVDLARVLSKQGFRSLRFDLSGIGDSSRSMSDLPHEEQALVDMAEAVDDLSARGLGSQFVMIGLCTGAYNALAAASQDRRIDGCVLIDGYAYETPQSRLRHQTRRLTQAWRWKRYLKRKIGGSSVPATPKSIDDLVFQPVLLPKQSFQDQIESLISRGVGLKLVYTGHGPQPYNYDGQFRDAFPNIDHNRVTVSFMRDANHTFTRKDHRDELVSEIGSWLTGTYPEDEPSSLRSRPADRGRPKPSGEAAATNQHGGPDR